MSSRGDVVDIGCGLGDNAIFLALRSLQVTGLDSSLSAVNQARARALANGANVTFDIADATELTGYDDAFDTVLDSALYHCLTEQKRHDYVAALARSTRPGARLHLFCFTTEGPPLLPAPYLVSEANLHGTIENDWTIERLELTLYTVAYPPEALRAGVQALQGVDLPVSRFTALATDDDGRALVPAWQLRAVRSAT